MSKYWNELSIGLGVCGGFTAKLLGGNDLFLKALILAICLDYLTGFLKGIYTKSLSSERGYKGFIKKIMLLIMVAAAHIVNVTLSPSIPIREAVIIFFLSNEILSILENAAKMDMKLPAALIEVLLSQRGEEAKK